MRAFNFGKLLRCAHLGEILFYSIFGRDIKSISLQAHLSPLQLTFKKQYNTLAPSFPAAPGRPCSPGGPGGPG